MSSTPLIGETRIRVRYAETDQMGVVYHANYLVWFEIGRAEFIRQIGISYKEIEREEGCGIAVVEATCRYRSPARYDDELLIRTRIVGYRATVIKFAYEVLRAEDNQLLCEGATTHVVVGMDMKKRTLPERYAERFRAHRITTLDTPAP